MQIFTTITKWYDNPNPHLYLIHLILIIILFIDWPPFLHWSPSNQVSVIPSPFATLVENMNLSPAWNETELLLPPLPIAAALSFLFPPVKVITFVMIWAHWNEIIPPLLWSRAPQESPPQRSPLDHLSGTFSWNEVKLRFSQVVIQLEFRQGEVTAWPPFRNILLEWGKVKVLF